MQTRWDCQGGGGQGRGRGFTALGASQPLPPHVRAHAHMPEPRCASSRAGPAGIFIRGLWILCAGRESTDIVAAEGWMGVCDGIF